MRRTLTIIALLSIYCATLHAQPRPGAFTTVVTTDTSAKSVCVGANQINSPSSCTGEMSAGNIAAAGTVIATGAATFGGIVSSTGAGTHAFDATATNVFRVRNTTAGAAQLAAFQLGNNAAAGLGTIYALSSTYTSAGALIANSMAIDSQGAGGLGLSASAGAINFFVGGTQRWSFDTSGHFVPFATTTYNIGSTSARANQVFVADGSVSTPSLVFGTLGTTGIFGSGGTAGSVSITLSNSDAAQFLNQTGGGNRGLNLKAFNAATPNTGATLIVGNNLNSGGAGGSIQFTRLGSTVDCVWSDNTGVMRTNTSCPTTSSGDTGGTVIGTQTSTRASKVIFGAFTDNRAALTTILHTPVWTFEYKSGAYQRQQFVGITTDDSPEFGMDDGKSFNPVTSFGYTVAAIKALQEQIEALTARIAELEARKR